MLGFLKIEKGRCPQMCPRMSGLLGEGMGWRERWSRTGSVFSLGIAKEGRCLPCGARLPVLLSNLGVRLGQAERGCKGLEVTVVMQQHQAIFDAAGCD